MDKALFTTYARQGIVARRQELEAELERLRVAEQALDGDQPMRRKRRELSAAERMAVSKRMKRYWAERRQNRAK